MAFEGIRSRLRSLAGSGKETASEAPERIRKVAEDERLREGVARTRDVSAKATGAVAKRAPATGLEDGSEPVEPGSRKAIARRLQGAGQIRKPIGDATLAPGADPRYIERFARGDETTAAWFGENEAPDDLYETYFAQGEPATEEEVGPFVMELLDEQDHEGGLYAYDDEHEEGIVDDGVDVSSVGVDFRW